MAAEVSKHPKYDQAASSLKQRLESRIDADRQSAIALLDHARKMLVLLVENSAIAVDDGILDEIAVLSNVIEGLDPKCLDDDATGQLGIIQDRLLRLAESLSNLV